MAKKKKEGAQLLWGGRFSAPPSEVLKRFNDSFAFDRELLPEDVYGSVGWANALHRAGVLNADETKRIVTALEAISDQGIPEGDESAEDVHSWVEAELRKRVGALAGKLHTGRSRNDQVATDLALYVGVASVEAAELLLELAEALVSRAAEEAATPMPGYTHLKRAEPITFGHWCLAYVEMLFRDLSRFASAVPPECPLGSGALSGTPLGVDRARLAKELGFERPTANSLDAVSSRDSAADYLYAASLLLVHLSRLAEDLIFFSSDEAGFVELPDALATGSSRMPQKKNPDVLELVRGHAGRAIGELTGLLATIKGLPLAYDKDLQLDKEPLFRTRFTLETALPALTLLVAGLKLDKERMLAAASDDRLLATELADALAARGVPFREAHEIVGKRFAEAVEKKTTFRELGEGGGITAQDLEALDVRRALGKRQAEGGTAPIRVRLAAAVARKQIAKLRGGKAK